MSRIFTFIEEKKFFIRTYLLQKYFVRAKITAMQIYDIATVQQYNHIATQIP